MKGIFPHFDIKPWLALTERAVEALESIAEDLTALARKHGEWR